MRTKKLFLPVGLSLIGVWVLLLGFASSSRASSLSTAGVESGSNRQPSLTNENVIFVNVTATGNNNGSSWENAYTNLQNALSSAQNGDEIWVAEGVYIPGTTVSDTFTMTAGVALYGGFSGTETLRDQRDWEAHVTVLSGDIDNNDIKNAYGVVTSSANIKGNNAHHVINSANLTETAILDGFTITAGKAYGSAENPCRLRCGGGMYNYQSNPSLVNITFSGNFAGYGGGMGNENSNPALNNVIFSGNKAGSSGGGMYNLTSNPFLSNINFSSNVANYGSGMYNFTSSPTLTHVIFSKNTNSLFGGGLYNQANSHPTLTNVIFSGNTTINDGGGIYNEESSPTFSNVTLIGNVAAQNGGGMYNYFNASPTLTNVTFSGNSAGNNGGGMYNYSTSQPTIVNTILWGNTASGSGNQLYNLSITPNISFSDIQGCGGSSSWISTCGNDFGNNIDIDPSFMRNPNDGGDGWGNGNDDYGDLHLQPGSPAIDSGTNTGCPGSDLDGEPRPENGTCDMGAYEAGFLLSIQKLVDDPTPQPGQKVTFSIIVTNHELDITGGLISDHLPAEMNFITGSIALEPSNSGLAGSFPPTLASALSISYTENVTLTFSASITFGLAAGTQLVNVAAFSSTALVNPIQTSLTLTVINAPPKAADDGPGEAGFTTDEDTPFTTGSVLLNDTDPNWDTISIQSFNTSGTKGLVTNNGDGTFDYDPNQQFEALPVGGQSFDIFTYTVSDGVLTDTALVTITITGVNDPPLAVPDSGVGFTANEETPFITANILTNDSDPDGDAFGLQNIYTTTVLGKLTEISEGIFEYDPDGQFEYLGSGVEATDIFSYTIYDGNGSTATATVTITISGVNDPPIAISDNGSDYTTDQDSPFTTGNVLLNDSDLDGDILVINEFDINNTVGNLSYNGNGTFHYDPNNQFDMLAPGEETTDTFTYTINDGHGGSDFATVVITVTGLNDAPLATDDSGTGFIGDEDNGFTTANVLLNDSDPDGDTISLISIDTSGTKGLLTSNSDGTFTYDPDGQFEYLAEGSHANDAFSYTISDGHSRTDSATVTITINGVNDAPVALDDSGLGFTTYKSSTFTTASVFLNDSDIDGDTLFVLSFDTSLTLGLVINNGDGTFEYDPNGQFDALTPDEQASDTFSYTVSDGHGGTATANVTITVTGSANNLLLFLPAIVR